jgi:DNA-binding transcriptional LysR family regulator
VSTILDDVKRAENKMHQIATDGGHIDIAYVSPLAKVFIPTIVRSFLTEKENKNITFNFFQDITSVNIDGLKKGRYDIIFGSYSPDENGIDFVPIIKQEIVAILPPGHPLTLKDTMEATDFADYPVLGYARHSGLGKYTRSFFKKHDVSPNFICESPDENGIASLVAQGFGIALVADVDAIHRDDICIRHLVSHESFSHTVYMGYMTGKYQLPAIKRFIEFVRKSCS